MSWQAIARNDLRGVSRERGSWALFVGFLLGFGGLAALLVQLGDPDFEVYLDILAPGVGLLVPLAGIVLGYETVVGERESGTVVLSLSMPHSRASMVLGKLVGRTTLLVSVVASAAFVTGVGMAVAFPAFELPRYVGFVLLSSLYGAVFLWLSTALSMALPTGRRVIVAAFGAYIGLTLFWNILIDIVETVLFRFRPGPSGEPEAWATFATFVGPRTSFNYLLGSDLDAGAIPPVAVDASAEFVSSSVAMLALAAWAVLPVVVGYREFRNDDL